MRPKDELPVRRPTVDALANLREELADIQSAMAEIVERITDVRKGLSRVAAALQSPEKAHALKDESEPLPSEELPQITEGAGEEIPGRFSCREIQGVSVVSTQIENASLLDQQEIYNLRQELVERIDQGCRRMLFDLSGVVYLSHTALALLIKLNSHLRHNEGKLVICGVDPQVNGVFIVTGLNRLFTIVNDLQQGLAEFPQQSPATKKPEVMDSY